MIWTRERYIAHCLHEYTGREMFTELFGPLHALEAEWRSQGASEKEIGMTAFDWDFVLKTGVSGACGPISEIEPKILEDTGEYTRSLFTFMEVENLPDTPELKSALEQYGSELRLTGRWDGAEFVPERIEEKRKVENGVIKSDYFRVNSGNCRVFTDQQFRTLGNF